MPSLFASVAAFFFLAATALAGEVNVFILAGQSNMEGKARNTLLDY